VVIAGGEGREGVRGKGDGFRSETMYCSNRSALDQPMRSRSPSRSTDPDLRAAFPMPYHFTPLGRAPFDECFKG